MAEPRSAAEFAEASAETELKFLISEESIAQLSGHRALKSPEQSSRLRSIYFDTLDHALRDAGLSLRVREADGSLMQTIKRRTSPGQVARDEWEQPIASAEPDRAGFARTPVARLLEEAAPDLQPLFVTDVNRSVRYWTQADALIEISLDRGEVVAGTRREPILELELELKRGSPAALFELARDLSQTAPLRLSFESKGERGYRLAGHDGIIAYKADAAQVGSGQPTAEALQAIARSCLSQLLANADQFLRRRNPEALHQLRIGLRRLRAAMSTFKSLLGDAQSQHLKAEAKWLSGELNAARDLDVFLQDTLRPEEQAREHPAELEPLAKWLALAQAKAYDRAFAALESPRFSALVLEVAAWTEVGAWASPAEPEA
ncbi:MAG: CYTH and CHAD domain-containing protein, partial [Phenylobacterium sp.]